MGPRQCGKTTLAKACFPRLPYVTLEDPDVRRAASSDPRYFLGRYADGAVLDEIQNAPELMSYLQGVVDAEPERKVYCLDGDGASIMHFGNMAIAGQSGCGNLTHIVFNNAAHDSVGGQPTVGGAIDLVKTAAACGYNRPGAPVFREIKVAKGARKDLGRPKEPLQANKKLYMRSLGLAV